MTRKLFVTTALPYANAPFHIGHMMEYIQADIWVRFRAHGEQRSALRLRRRRARRADHDRGRKGRQDAAGLRRRDRGRAQEVPRRLPDRLRQLALDRRTREPRTRAGHLPGPPQAGPDRRAHHRAVLRPGQGHVPARPLHQGHLPEMRHARPVRRQLRELRCGLRAHRSEEPVLDAERRDAGAQEQRALLLPALVATLHRFPQRVDHHARPPAARGAEQDQGVVRGRRAECHGRPERLGHQPRRALLRHRDPRCAGQVLLRLARCAGRLPRVAEESPDEARRGLRCVHGRPRSRADPLHRERHRHLPHACSGRRCCTSAAARCRTTSTCTASCNSERREDEQEPRHRHLAAEVPRARHELRVASLLHRGKAEFARRRPGLQSGRFPGAGQQRPGRQVHQHREPCGGLPEQALRWTALERPRRRRAARCSTRCARTARRSKNCTNNASSARRCAR